MGAVIGCERDAPSATAERTGPSDAEVIITDDAGKLVTFSSFGQSPCWTLVAGRDGAPVWKRIEVSDDCATGVEEGWLSNPTVTFNTEFQLPMVVVDSHGRVLFAQYFGEFLVLAREPNGALMLKQIRASDSAADGSERGWLDTPVVITSPARHEPAE